MTEEKEIKIRLLEFPECVREKVGMYVGGAEDATVIFREIIDNSMDEAYSSSCDNIFIHQNFNEFHFVADNGRGLPITMSTDKPDQTQASLAVGSLHAGSKFDGSSSGDAKIGTNGVGSSCTNALSTKFVVLSRVTKDNYDKSLPIVKEVWDSFGPRSKGDIYYYLEYNKGYKVKETAGKLHDLEKFIFGDKYKESLPEGYSTYVLFQPDKEIFESVKSKLPIKNLEYFMLIQEKFYKKHVNVIVNGQSIADTYPRYKYEVCKTITPADTSFNKKVGFYMTFEVDPNLGGRDTMASVNGLVTDQGHHVQIAEICYKDALIRNYNITHNYLLNGLRMIVVVLCQECMFDSQTKVRLKSIVKVKSSDFEEVTKEIMKVFKSDPEYWDLHAQRLNAYAESMVSLSTMDRIKKDLMKSVTAGGVKGKAFLPDKLSDATAGMKERMKCELFLCFTGDTEVLTCNNERIKFIDLVDRINKGEEIYTFSCDESMKIYPSKIIKAWRTGFTKELAIVRLDNGEVIKCTPDHRFMMRDGSYKEAKDLSTNDSLMPCYITEYASEDYGGCTRRAIQSSNQGGAFRAIYGSHKKLNNGNYLYPIYRIMSFHKDVRVHDSINNLSNTDTIARHHIDGNPLNDSPRNLELVSANLHLQRHGGSAIMKLALSDKSSDLYRRLFGDLKFTDEWSDNRSLKTSDYFDESTQTGRLHRENLSTKSRKQWKNEDLRKWRSEETSRYAKENPDLMKEKAFRSKELAKISVLNEVLSSLGSVKDLNEYLYNSICKIRHKKFPRYSSIMESDLCKLMTKYYNESFNFESYRRVSYSLITLSFRKVGINETSYNLYQRDRFIAKKRGNYNDDKFLYKELFELYESYNNNHKVSSVELISVDNEPVFCLEVDNENHNFPLAAGVFVHNCEGRHFALIKLL